MTEGPVVIKYTMSPTCLIPADTDVPAMCIVQDDVIVALFPGGVKRYQEIEQWAKMIGGRVASIMLTTTFTPKLDTVRVLGTKGPANDK
jgi:hypothetical protein